MSVPRFRKSSRRLFHIILEPGVVQPRDSEPNVEKETGQMLLWGDWWRFFVSRLKTETSYSQQRVALG